MSALRQIHLLLLLAMLPALLAAWLHPVRPDWRRNAAPVEGMVSLSELPAPQDEILWIDARSRMDYEAEHIPGALLLNEDEWDALFFDALDSLADLRPIVVYCGGGGCRASEAVAERLRRELGRDDIYVLEGGWTAWEER